MKRAVGKTLGMRAPRLATTVGQTVYSIHTGVETLEEFEKCEPSVNDHKLVAPTERRESCRESDQVQNAA